MSGVTRSKLVFKTYLSFALINDCLSSLQEIGMISYDDETRLYKTTEKGLQFLHAWEAIDMLLYSKINTHEQKVCNLVS
jgi:predicted transcriptional regulator